MGKGIGIMQEHIGNQLINAKIGRGGKVKAKKLRQVNTGSAQKYILRQPDYSVDDDDIFGDKRQKTGKTVSIIVHSYNLMLRRKNTYYFAAGVVF
jgi:hypothetical protein